MNAKCFTLEGLSLYLESLIICGLEKLTPIGNVEKQRCWSFNMGKEYDRFKEQQNKDNRIPVTSFTLRDGTAGKRLKDLPSREPRGVYDPSRGF